MKGVAVGNGVAGKPDPGDVEGMTGGVMSEHVTSSRFTRGLERLLVTRYQQVAGRISDVSCYDVHFHVLNDFRTSSGSTSEP